MNPFDGGGGGGGGVLPLPIRPPVPVPAPAPPPIPCPPPICVPPGPPLLPAGVWPGEGPCFPPSPSGPDPGATGQGSGAPHNGGGGHGRAARICDPATGEEPPVPEPAPGGGAEGCFAAGTLVLTETGLVAIECVTQGTEVWTYDLGEMTWQLRAVIGTSRSTFTGSVLTIALDGALVQATGDHPFWVLGGTGLTTRPSVSGIPEEGVASLRAGRWVYARDLRVGDALLCRDGERRSVSGIEARIQSVVVFNLQVESPNTFAVGRHGELVHNKPRKRRGLDFVDRLIDKYSLTDEEVEELHEAFKAERNNTDGEPSEEQLEEAARDIYDNRGGGVR